MQSRSSWTRLGFTGGPEIAAAFPAVAGVGFRFWVVAPVLVLLLGASGALAAETKKKPSPVQKWVSELAECAAINDGKCVAGLTDSLKKSAKEACPLLAASLGTTDRQAALVVEAMADLACPQTVAVALDYVGKSESETRMEVFEAACLMRDKAVLPMAEQILGGNRGYEKERVCFALGRMKLDEALPLLLKASADGIYVVRQMAAIALGNYKGKSVTEVLCKLATADSNAGVRTQAVHSLKSVADWNTIPCLIQALGDREPDVHFAAHEAIMAVAGLDLGTKPGAWSDWWKNGAKKPQ